MHINNWVHASDLMKMVKSANSASTLSFEEGLPDNHVITIRERELTVDFPELIQNNIKTDTVTLDLDAEWDGIQPVIIFGPNADGTIAVEYTGEPVHIPGAVMQYVGGLDCSVMGLDDSGEVRLVTKAAPNTFEVVESGEYIGQISEDDVSLLGQILSAIKDAETATSDASSAAEDATAAADSANTAATKATNAADSANTAATKATAAANSANTASERAENAYDVLTPIIAEIGVNGNQPRATTNPNHVATASDAYAAKPLEICIKGATRQNLWVNPTATVSGITVTSNADGSVTLSGTSTRPSDTYIMKPIYTVKPNTAYTLSIDKRPSGFSVYAQEYTDSTFFANLVAINYDSERLYSTETTSESGFTLVNVMFRIKSGDTVSGTYRVMLNEGSEPEPWCPPGLNSVDELSLVTAGKNLLVLRNDLAPKTDKGITFTPNANGSITVNGTATGPAFYNIDFVVNEGSSINTIPQGETYTLSGESTHCVIQCSYFVSGGSDRPWLATNGESSDVLPLEAKKLRTYLQVNTGNVVNNEVVYPQLELGSTATPYEPPNVTTTPLPEVELRSLPNGTCDELVIGADGTCEVERNTVQVTFDGSEDENWSQYTPNTLAFTAYCNDFFADSPVNATNNVDAAYAVVCRELPVIQSGFDQSTPCVAASHLATRNLYVTAPSTVTDIDSFKQWLADNPITCVVNVTGKPDEPQSPVTLPTLPSPNITVYHDSDVPSDITVEYVQDINIVLDNLNAKIAALNVAQSSSS